MMTTYRGFSGGRSSLGRVGDQTRDGTSIRSDG